MENTSSRHREDSIAKTGQRHRHKVTEKRSRGKKPGEQAESSEQSTQARAERHIRRAAGAAGRETREEHTQDGI